MGGISDETISSCSSACFLVCTVIRKRNGDIVFFDERGRVRCKRFFSDSCSFISVELTASKQGSHNLGPTASNFGVAFIFYANSCTGIVFFENGFGSIQFLARGAASGTHVPTSVIASGVIPMSCVGSCSSPTDNVTFNMSLTQVGIVESLTSEFHDTMTATTPIVTEIVREDLNRASATGTVTVSSQNLGPLPVSPLGVADSKIHVLMISH